MIKILSGEEYSYKMFGYLLMVVITIAIFIGLYIIVQHQLSHESQTQFQLNQQKLIETQGIILDNQEDIADANKLILINQNDTETNQKLILENQKRLDRLASDAKMHEEREEKVFGNSIVNNNELILNLTKHMYQFEKRYQHHFNQTLIP